MMKLKRRNKDRRGQRQENEGRRKKKRSEMKRQRIDRAGKKE